MLVPAIVLRFSVQSECETWQQIFAELHNIKIQRNPISGCQVKTDRQTRLGQEEHLCNSSLQSQQKLPWIFTWKAYSFIKRNRLQTLSQRQHCLKQDKIFSKALLLLQHNTKDEIFLSGVKKDKPASGITKTQEVFNLIVCSSLHLGCFSLSSSLTSYILSTFYRAIWDKSIQNATPKRQQRTTCMQ